MDNIWLRVILIVLVALIVVWGIYAIIITAPWPLDEGKIIDMTYEPYGEYETEERREVTSTISYFSIDANGNTVISSREIHDYWIYYQYLNKDFEDYTVTIEGEREANYIFWKQKHVYSTKYFISKSYYDFLEVGSFFSAKEYSALLDDTNNEKILLKEWRD